MEDLARLPHKEARKPGGLKFIRGRRTLVIIGPSRKDYEQTKRLCRWLQCITLFYRLLAAWALQRTACYGRIDQVQVFGTAVCVATSLDQVRKLFPLVVVLSLD